MSLRSRDLYLQRTYGITLQDYDDLLQKQGGACYICRRSPEELDANLCVDHDHKTMVIRGLLCVYCNKFVIGRHRDPEVLLRASEYLRGPFTDFIVPPKKKKRKKNGKNSPRHSRSSRASRTRKRKGRLAR